LIGCGHQKALTDDRARDETAPRNRSRARREAGILERRRTDKIGGVVFTMREEKIRLISVRHVRPEEKEFYEQN
jgi:uncharacterized DUF497 family protein